MFARALLATALFAGPAGAGECDAPARNAERALGIPPGLLAAIGRVESGRREPGGRWAAWPWSVNALGRDYILGDAAAAAALVGGLQAQGVRSIDVGCFQVNLRYHPEAFASLAEAFDPAANAAVAGRLLRQLRGGAPDWQDAVARYHSADSALGLPYLRQVMADWGRGPVAGPHFAWLPVVWTPAAWTPLVWSPAAAVRAIAPGGMASPWRAGGMRLPVVIIPGGGGYPRPRAALTDCKGLCG